jgi:hypothetical protein
MLGIAAAATVLGAMTALPAYAGGGITGQWEFNGNFLASEGSALTATGTWAFTTSLINGETAQVASFTNGSYLSVPTGASPNGGGTKINRYSVIMDVFFPTVPTPGFISLLQTDSAPAGSDGDWFINGSNGMGISSDYTDTGNATRFTRGQWQRIALVIDTTSPTGAANQYRSYVNGVLQNIVGAPSGWGLDNRFSLNPSFFLFADEDGETSSGLINSLQFREYAMSDAEVLALGGPTAVGVAPEPGSLLLALPGLVALGIARRRRF